MKKVVGTALLGLVMFGVATMACRKEDAAPTATTPSATATGYPAPGYPPATGYPATGYPPATATAYPPATGYPPATAAGTAPLPPQGGTMAVPGPLALPCQNDSGCGLARCNVQYQKCAFPCVNAAIDCIGGAQCIAGACVPKLGQ